MKMVFAYLYEYFKLNQFLAYLIVFLIGLSLVKYLRFRLRVSPKLWLTGLLLAGVFLRLGWLEFSSHQPKTTLHSNHVSEADLINVHAIQLTQGIWFQDALGKPSGRRPIGYPLFLGALYKLFGIHLSVVRVAHLIFFLATGILVYLMSRLLFSESAGLLAAGMFVFYPISIYSFNLITDEHLFLFIWYLGLFLLFREIRSKPVKFSWVWYGLLFGYATMTRTHTLFMPFVVAWVILLKQKSWIKALRTAFLVGLTMQLINLPWVIRNYRVWKVPILYTATAGFIYAQMNSSAGPEGSGHIPERGEPGFSEELEAASKLDNPGVYHQLANREMSRWIVSHPKKFLALGTARLLHLMNWNRRGGVWPIYYQYAIGCYDPKRPLSENTRAFLEELAFIAYYLLLYPFLISVAMLAAKWRTLSRETQISLLALAACFLFWFLEHMVIYPDRKYRYPLEPLMMIVASYFLNFLLLEFRWERIGARLKCLFTRSHAVT